MEHGRPEAALFFITLSFGSGWELLGFGYCQPEKRGYPIIRLAPLYNTICSTASMGLFNRRSGPRPAPRLPADESLHGIRNALRRLVETSTLISPPADHGPPERLHVTIAVDRPTKPTNATAAMPIIVLGHSTLARLQSVFQDMCRRTLSIALMPLAPAMMTQGHTLTQVRLARFLRDVQEEPRLPALTKDRYTFEDFLELLALSAGWDAQKLPDAKDLDTSHPISHYFVSSSHNTYLVGNQLSSDASVDEYRKVLERNCRCIEIDVWNPPARSGRTGGRGSGRTAAHDRSKSPGKQLHGRHTPSNSVATSIQEGIDAVASLITGRTTLSRSRASSTSQAPPAGETSTQETLLQRSMATTAIEDDDAAVADAGTTMSRTASTVLTQATTDAGNTTTTSMSTMSSSSAGTPEPDEPVVMHAHTLARSDWTLGTQVPFRDVCRAVRSAAFADNDLPLIVSLEVHTNAAQQRQMVKIMREEWGDLLLDQQLDGTDPRLRLPTLEELKRKILVKVKKPAVATSLAGGTGATSGTTATTATTTATITTTTTATTEDSFTPRPALHHVVGLGTSLLAVANNAGALSGSEDDEPNAAPVSASLPPSSITHELGSLAVYTESRRFTNFSDRAAKLPGHIFSLDDTVIQTLHGKQHEELFQHNKKYLMRAYPNATKHVSSSNPDPAPCWRRGVQMVALNWQTLDKAMMLNHAMFAGSPGWVLKPPGYHSSGGATVTAATAATSTTTCPVAVAAPVCTIDLYITILAGQHLPLPPSLLKRGGHRLDEVTGIVSGHARKDFRPYVRAELNVERPDERCPEVADCASSSAAAAAATTTAPATSTFASIASVFGSAAVPELSLRQKTVPARTDQPDWGSRGSVMRFRNIAGIVEALSFIVFCVEDDGTRPTVSLGRNDALAGWASFRLDQLRTGYRFISLMDGRGNPTDGKLLVLVEKVVK
ncbi:phospholipase c [Grosmannia clavigera kw1407]|uniref:Phosphoinositide phospholipase C n=1 Tax=Grosmannia clavigera (strain kw1407 / UAMH 11150) TaxID=655863 RepID=F0XK32_GROCL|nr:phospholipase c [Grosmannia clavigera kw1407]EFX01967.1 phospholipase c [Grosmannia clavigera kw1407]